MKLSLKQKAVALTVGLFALSVVIALAVNFIVQNVSARIIINTIGASTFGLMMYLIYSLILNRLEMDQSLNDLRADINLK